jgi:hypothetical protein
MKNVTVSMDDETLKAARDYARCHNMSLNSLVRRLIAQQVVRPGENWVDECFALMDKARGRSRGRRWRREDLYDL